MAAKGTEAGVQNGHDVHRNYSGGGLKGVPSDVAFVLDLISGTPIQLTTKEGDIFDGIYESHICINQIHGLSMRLARLVSSSRPDKIKAAKGANLKFKFSEVVSVTTLEGVDFSELTTSGNASVGKDSFATDTDISKSKAAGKAPRELAKWEASDPVGEHLTLDAPSSAKLGTHWDQFAVNKELFGITTSFDENTYTIPLDRSSKDFKTRETEAEKIAEEIMGSLGKSGNVHLAEERGEEVDDSGMDEEDKYGAVVRDSEAADKVGTTTQVPARSRMTHRKSITNVNADSESLEAALQAVQTASQTVHRRLSLINESDLAALLATESKEAAAKLSETVKTKKLNPNASEFEPTFEAAVVAPPAPVHEHYGNQTYGYYDPYQGNAQYYDPNYYYANPYYGQASYHQGQGGYQDYPYQNQQTHPSAPHHQPPPNPEAQ